MRKLKVLELFSGTRSIGKAFESSGHEVYSVDWNADFEASWHTDIGGIRAKDIIARFGHPDVVWASPDCFTEGHIVWTSDGYKNIENVHCGDYVLTHKGRMRKVTRFIKKSAYDLLKVKISGCEWMCVTPEHPFLARKKERVLFSRREARYVLQEPEWVEAKDLTSEYRVGIPINQESIVPTWDGVVKMTANKYGITNEWIENKLEPLMGNPDFWWFVGRYFGDGYMSPVKQVTVDISCGYYDDQIREIRQHLNRLGFKFSERETRTAYHFGIFDKELCAFLEQFGVGSPNKSITPTILNLPIDLLRQFLDGYVSADGHWDFHQKVPTCTVTTVSKGLAYGLQQCLLKAFGVYGSMLYKEKNNTVIEGRKVNCKPVYTVAFRLTPRRTYYTVEDGMAWVNVKSVERVVGCGYKSVYTLSVDEDESFTVGNIAVHNCTTFSVAAISKHRKVDEVLGGGIAISPYAQKCDQVDLNVIRLLRDLRPTLYFIENPRGMLRKMPWMQWSPMYTVCYCQYLTKLPIEQRRMKPTDIWTNHPNPNFLPPCKNGDPCHVRAPRGSVTGTQGLKLVDKYRIPEDLCAHIVSISEDYIKRVDMANGWLSAYGFEPITPQWDDGPYEPIQLSMDITS